MTPDTRSKTAGAGEAQEDAYGHLWVKFTDSTVACKKCGWVKGGKKGEQPCKGSPGISLRSAESDTVQIPRSTLEAVREALMPFAGMGTRKPTAPDDVIAYVRFTNGDLRKAAAALALIEKELGNG